MIIPSKAEEHPAITRVFGGKHEKKALPNKEKLAYSRRCLALCEENGWRRTAQAWNETIEALEEAVFADMVHFGGA